MQDGVDLLAALAGSPDTARYLATKLYRFFVSETGVVSDAFVNRIASVYLASGYDMRTVMRNVLLAPEFWDSSAYFARYSWPVEFVVRLTKNVGWTGFTVASALAPLSNMGQNLFEPPNVGGWEQGQRWFSTGAMLSRMNFAATVAANQRFNLATSARPFAGTPEALLSHVSQSMPAAPLGEGVVGELLNYLRATGAWTGGATQLQAKVPGLVHLMAATAEYQFV
jgi:uncharacterized protein (DUF1800 family)